MEYQLGIDVIAKVMAKAAQTAWFGNFYVREWELPRCSGRASPEVIDTMCIDENENHEWEVYVDDEYGERFCSCIKCGYEP